ncbi:fimbrial protein [Photorhabdus luminescens]|uniref:fimbrial protein n=1 Tax=Photorhabdus luminescens TaxID=29488 RepID=UPI002240D2E5|nr:fimbrial protein [Photorhabdus luminescens]MCW7763157.1 fimbrial protein [Photorhabdus luminescens subsp. venezuelensis]
MKNKLIILTILLLTLLSITKSIASCELNPDFKAIDLNVDINKIINSSNNHSAYILIAQYGPMELTSKINSKKTFKADSTIANCDNNEAVYFKTTSDKIASANNPNDSGIIRTSANNIYYYIKYLGNGKSNPENKKLSLKDIGEVQVYLYQSGDLTPGDKLKKGLISSLSTYDGKELIRIKYNKENVIENTSCMTSTPYQKLVLGRHKSSDFNGKWQAARKSSSFNISIECKNNILPTIVFSGETIDEVDKKDKGSVIRLNKYGSGKEAKGVGVQMIHKGIPVAMKKPITATSSGGNGAYYIPLSAHYYQTGDTIKGGTANASVQFTIEYK